MATHSGLTSPIGQGIITATLEFFSGKDAGSYLERHRSKLGAWSEHETLKLLKSEFIRTI